MIQWRASVLMESGKYKEAQKDIRRLLQYQSSPQLKSYLGLTYYYQDDPDSALMMFDEVIQEDPNLFSPMFMQHPFVLMKMPMNLRLVISTKVCKRNRPIPRCCFTGELPW